MRMNGSMRAKERREEEEEEAIWTSY